MQIYIDVCVKNGSVSTWVIRLRTSTNFELCHTIFDLARKVCQ